MAKVKIYSTATCAFCRAEKSYLAEKGITFEEIHADQDRAAAEELFEVSGQLGVPFTVITKDDGSTIRILGFDQPKLNEALGL